MAKQTPGADARAIKLAADIRSLLSNSASIRYFGSMSVRRTCRRLGLGNAGGRLQISAPNVAHSSHSPDCPGFRTLIRHIASSRTCSDIVGRPQLVQH